MVCIAGAGAERAMKRAGIACLFGLVALTVGGAPAAAATTPRAERVFVFSVPALAYADVDAATMPALHAFLDRAAIADLSTRVDGMETSIADGYATIGAGTRTLGARRDAGLAFDALEPFGPTTAGEEFTRRTGTPAGDGLVYLAQPALRAANVNKLFGTQIGALGDALGAAGHSAAVIANADVPRTPADIAYERTAATGLADRSGRVPAGQLASSLLQPDAQAAYGIRLDSGAVDAAFAGAFTAGSVVMVEASDLWRAELASNDTEASVAHARHARQTSDALFATLLQRVDPTRDAVVVVGPRYSGTTLALSIAALQAPGVRPGYLQSATTRRPGFVQLVDVAPTVLTLSGVAVPGSMEGRPFTTVPGSGSAASRRAALIDANRAAQFRDRIIGPVTAGWIIGQVLLCGAAVAAFMTIRGAQLRPFLAPAALGLLAVPLGLWLAGLMPFFSLGAAWYVAFVVAVAAGVATVASLGFRRNVFDPVIAMLSALVVLLVVDIATGAHLQLNTAFGYSPTIAGRFAGIGNLAYAILGAAAVFLAGLLAHRIPGRNGRITAAVLLGVVCLVDGLPFLGADVGGMLSLVPASAVMVWLLLGKRIRGRTVLIGGAVTVAVVLAVGFLDLMRPASSRTHLGRLFERIGNQGWDGLWVILRRKAESNLGVLGLSIWTLLIPVLFVLLGFLLYRAPGRLRDVKRAIPEIHATLVGFGVLAVLGFALNDSGIAIPGVMLGVANTVLVFLCVRIPEPEILVSEPINVEATV